MRARLLALGVALLVAVPLIAACGDSGDGSAAGSTGSSTDHVEHVGTTAAFEGGLVEPRRAAPPLRLKDIDGKVVNLTDYKGSPVLVTFVYASCPDVCPLIMSNLRQIHDASKLGRSVKVIAVSVNPEGDTVPVVRSFLERQHVGGFVDYLVGTRAELEPVWADWQVATEVPKDNPELVEHSALIYGVAANGDLTTAYPVGFEPAGVTRDLPLLAKS